MPELEGQAQATPAPEAQASTDIASQEVDLGNGQRMTVGNLVKSYGSSRTEMQNALNQVRDLKDQNSAYQNLADRYQNDPAFRQGMDSLLDGKGIELDEGTPQAPVQNPLRPEVQQLQNLERSVATLQQNHDLEMLRSKYGMTQEQELSVLKMINENPSLGAELAYKSIYFDEMKANAQSQGAQQMANQMSENASSYQPPPSSTSGSPPAKAPADMTADEHDAAAVAKFKQLDFGQ